MPVIAAERLAKLFVQVADTLTDEFDLVEFLQMLTSQTSDLISARAVGILLVGSNQQLRLMAASDERAEMLELFQVQTREGPCQDCFRSGEPVVNVDLDGAAGTWPRFAPRAVQAGYHSVHAFPLRLRQQVLGAMNLFSEAPGQLDAESVAIVQSLADVATIGLLQERAIRHGETVTDQLQAALDSRVVVEQAKGALAQMLDTTPDQAFVIMRDHCRQRGLRLSEVARAVTADPASVADLTRR